MVLATLALMSSACGSEAASASAPAAVTTVTSTLPAAAPAWPEAPEWAGPLFDYLEGYRTSLGHIDAVFPYLAEGVTWWSGEEGDRLRVGLRDTLLGLMDPDPVSRLPGPVFVSSRVVEGGLAYDLDWVHEALDPDRRLEVVFMAVGPEGVTGYSARSLTAAAREAPGTDIEAIDQIEARYVEIAERMSSGDAQQAAEMISDRPIWIDTGDGLERVDPRALWAEQAAPAFAGLPESTLSPLATTDLGFEGPEAPLVFFTPPESLLRFREGTIGGVGVYRWSPEPGTETLLAVEWFEQSHGVVDLALRVTPADFGVVLPDEMNPWITDPSLWPQEPGPGQVRTGTIRVAGRGVPVFNGSPAQQALLEWAIERYLSAGLPPPLPRSVAFPPSAACIINAGLAIDTGDGVDVQLCFDDEEACAGEACTPSAGAQATLLHELGHVWAIQHTDEATRQAFLEVRGLETWSGPGVIRDDSGTEHAAEILSWGLIEADTAPARLPDNDCTDLAEAFEVLTGVPMPRTCPVGR